jgi:Xaa-Pro aminopeptidase
MKQSIDRARKALEESTFDSLVLINSPNVRWMSGFSGSFGTIFLTKERAVFVTDSRYTIQANEQIEGFEIVELKRPKKLHEVISELAQQSETDVLGFEPSLTYAQYHEIAKACDEIGVAVSSLGSFMDPLRMVKTPQEIEKIKRATELADATMEHITRMIQPGIREIDICLDLEFFMRRQGAGVAFDTIAVSGVRSARPHGKPSEKELQSGEFVTLDFGANLDGYNSDITRTFVVSKADDRTREVYEQVLKAEVEAVKALKPGANGKDIDALAREILDEKDLNKYFGHGLGHGLGIEVHDPGGLSLNRDQEILAGQVWTVEPGVYIEGVGGVRIEDDVVVTEDGHEVLTHFTKELLELG